MNIIEWAENHKVITSLVIAALVIVSAFSIKTYTNKENFRAELESYMQNSILDKVEYNDSDFCYVSGKYYNELNIDFTDSFANLSLAEQHAVLQPIMNAFDDKRRELLDKYKLSEKSLAQGTDGLPIINASFDSDDGYERYTYSITGSIETLEGDLYLAEECREENNSDTDSFLSNLPDAQLESQVFNWKIQYSYAIAEGQVKNISGASLENVQAVVTFYDENDNFITSEDALIEYNPILSGQTSPYKVYATYNPAMKSARVEFKELIGGTIPTKY